MLYSTASFLRVCGGILRDLLENLHESCFRTLYETQRGHAELSVNGRCPGSPMQACRVKTESENSRTDVVNDVFDEYLDDKVTYDFNTR